ncbi:MAG: hypothetical protein WCL54_05815 [Clostridia bacterium]
MRKDGKQFIWYDQKGHGRNLYGEFRRSVEVAQVPASAVIHLFADTVYQLKVNGTFVGFGPVRFDPRFPQYDTYDFAPFLRPGRNVITLIVNYFGMKTYKSIPSQAGLCVWGRVGDVDVSTKFDGWKAKPSLSRQTYMYKTSFALNPIEIVEQCQEEPGWELPDFDDAHWADAVPLANQNAWGTFEQRTIGFMNLSEIDVECEEKVVPIENNFDVHGFELSLPYFYDDNAKDYSYFIAFSTWIWSPRKQDVVVNTFYGEYWLNGAFLPKGVLDTTKNMKFNEVWPLEEGWNFLFGKVGGYNDYLYQMFGVPKSAELVFAADKKLDSKYSFKHTTMLDQFTYNNTLETIPLPYSPDETLEEIGGWKLFPKSSMISAPCRFTSWDNYGDSFQTFVSGAPNTCKAGLYPHGFSILLDLGKTLLVFPTVKLTGVAGATVDLTYSETLLADALHLHHEHNYQSGDRIVCTQDTLSFFPIQPRGMRYLMLTVRNATADVTVESISVLDAAYPVEDIGSFECSDELLNQVWKQCVLTQRTNMEDVYVDCVTRERGMYIRDTVIQYYNNLMVFGDQTMMERCMQLYGQSPDESGKYRAVYPNSGTYTISDFCLNAIEGYHALYKFSGKTDIFKRDWDAMKANLAWFDELSDEREDLLLDANWDKKRNVFSQYGGFHGDLVGHSKNQIDNDGIHCVFTCTYLIAIDNMIEMALAIGQTEDALRFQARAATIRKNARVAFFDVAKGLYKDNLESDINSFHAQLFAIRANVATDDQILGIRTHIQKNLDGMFLNGFDPTQGVRFSPSYSFYIFDGLYKAGLYEVAEKLIRSGWGYFLYKGFTQVPEYHRISPGLSLCHAWSACPLYYLSAAFSGISFPDNADLTAYTLDVKAATVDWAKVKIPHPKGGVIEVEWHMEDGVRVFDKVAAPAGVTIKV